MITLVTTTLTLLLPAKDEERIIWIISDGAVRFALDPVMLTEFSTTGFTAAASVSYNILLPAGKELYAYADSGTPKIQFFPVQKASSVLVIP